MPPRHLPGSAGCAACHTVASAQLSINNSHRHPPVVIAIAVVRPGMLRHRQHLSCRQLRSQDAQGMAPLLGYRPLARSAWGPRRGCMLRLQAHEQHGARPSSPMLADQVRLVGCLLHLQWPPVGQDIQTECPPQAPHPAMYADDDTCGLTGKLKIVGIGARGISAIGRLMGALAFCASAASLCSGVDRCTAPLCLAAFQPAASLVARACTRADWGGVQRTGRALRLTGGSGCAPHAQAKTLCLAATSGPSTTT